MFTDQNSSVIVDTGFIVALFNEQDEEHALASQIAKKIDNWKWYTTPFIMQEIFWLLANRKNRDAAIKFFDTAKELLIIPELKENWAEQISIPLKKYAAIDFADASLVMLADLLRIGKIVSVDRKHFSILRWNQGKNSFNNLMIRSFGN